MKAPKNIDSLESDNSFGLQKILKPLAISSIIIASIWLISWGLLVNFIPDSVDRGAFGNMFGVVNSLFSAIAVVGVIMVMMMQKQELELQRKALEITRKELKESTKDNQVQADIQKITAQITGCTALLEAVTNRLNNPVVKGGSPNGTDLKYSPAQLQQFQTIYMDNISKLVNGLNEIGQETKPNEKPKESLNSK